MVENVSIWKYIIELTFDLYALIIFIYLINSHLCTMTIKATSV